MLLPVDEKRFFAHAHGDRTTLTVLSYHVLAQCHTHAQPYCSPHLLNWARRRQAQLDEILGYGADVVCLQDVDNYDEWWRRSDAAGYDRTHKRRTTRRRPREDGVLIAWRLRAFQLFRSEDLELNAAAEPPEIADAPRVCSRRRSRTTRRAHGPPAAVGGLGLPVLAVRRVRAARRLRVRGRRDRQQARRAPAPADPTRDAGATSSAAAGRARATGSERARAAADARSRARARGLQRGLPAYQPVVCGVALGDIPDGARRTRRS